MSLSSATQSCDQFGQATTHKLWRNLQHTFLILIETTQQATDRQQHGSEPQQWVIIILVQSLGHELLDMTEYLATSAASQECCHLIPAQMWTTIPGHTFHRHTAGAEKIGLLLYPNPSLDNNCLLHSLFIGFLHLGPLPFKDPNWVGICY